MERDLTPTTLTGPSGREYTLYGPKGDHQVRHWQAGHFYEGNKGGVLKWAWDNPQYFERVVDIGASLGNHSVFFAGELGAEVIAIEPYTSDIVQKNVDENGLGDRVTVKRELIGFRKPYRSVPGPAGNVGMTSFAVSGLGDEAVMGRGLADVTGVFSPTAIKIDAEGMSGAALIMSLNVVDAFGPAIIMEQDDPGTALRFDQILLRHTRLPQTFNATPTYVWIPS